jgi:hypothetical protein
MPKRIPALDFAYGGGTEILVPLSFVHVRSRMGRFVRPTGELLGSGQSTGISSSNLGRTVVNILAHVMNDDEVINYYLSIGLRW